MYCLTSRAATPGSTRCSDTGTSRRSSARARPTCRATGTRSPTRPGNLVDENGNQINGAYLTNYPGFPGFSTINASQTLAYMADMLESGVSVVTGYISDLHGNEDIPALSSACAHAGDALGSGTPCYIAQAQYYNDAFGTFFKRLAADGITPANTEFVLSTPMRATTRRAPTSAGPSSPRPANCERRDGRPCTYPAGTFGELDGNVTGLLAVQKHNTTQFGMEYDTAPEYYINGDPGPDAAVTRTFERDVSGLTAYNPYAGADPADRELPGRSRPRKRSCTWSTPTRRGHRRSGRVRQARLLPRAGLGDLQR